MVINKIFLKKTVLTFWILLSIVAVYPNQNILLLCGTVPKLVFRSIIIIILYIAYLKSIIRKKRIDCILMLVTIFLLEQLIVTFINKGDIVASIYSGFILVLASILVNDLFIDIDRRLYYRISFYYYFIMGIINVISGFLPNLGIFYQDWFFGNRNRVFIYYYPLLIFEFLISMIDEKPFDVTKRRIITYILVLFNVIQGGSLTSLLSIGTLILYMLVFYRLDLKIFNIFTYVVVYLILLLVMVIPGTKSLFMPIISNLLGKGKFASLRSYIYDSVIRYICNSNLIFGIGTISSDKMQEIITIKYYDTIKGKEIIASFNNAHNIFLETILLYGIVGLILLILIITMIVIASSYNDKKIKRVVHMFLFSLLLWSLMESASIQCIVYFLSIIYFSNVTYKCDFINKKFVNSKSI